MSHFIPLSELKEEVGGLWRSDVDVLEVVTLKDDIRARFGDLRFKATWERAFCYYYVETLTGFAMAAEPEGIYEFYLDIDSWPEWQQSLRLKILDCMLANPRCLEMLRNTLESLVRFRGISYATQTAHEFFGLVREKFGGSPDPVSTAFRGLESHSSAAARFDGANVT